ncbi:hypothetical protein EMIT074MI3_20935 [Bacillus licheniformis]
MFVLYSEDKKFGGDIYDDVYLDFDNGRVFVLFFQQRQPAGQNKQQESSDTDCY